MARSPDAPVGAQHPGPPLAEHTLPDPDRRLPLGEMLVHAGRLARHDLEEALAIQRRRSGRLGDVLVELGHIDVGALHQVLSEQAGLPVVDLEATDIDAEALALIPAEVALRHKVLPLHVRNGTLALAMARPFDRAAVEAVRVLSGRRIRRYHCPENALLDAARRAYGSNVARMIADLDAVDADTPLPADVQELTTQLQEMAREPTVVNLVNLVVLEAIDARASDIHLEPFERTLKVKYRIDGVLHEQSPPPKRLQAALTSRIKIMAGMNIAERFVPQDGHINFTVPKGKVDIRVATVPTLFGECVVMRLLDRSTGLLDLDQLGLNPACRGQFDRVLSHPHGIVLVTGPTGSGKTTTLYAALNRIYTPAKKIITIEDPVEYELEGINQIPINRRRGLEFANGLRAILRQDPDVIMVGEIRDRETADIAIRSALTGHLVFSTLHTNDAPGAVTRLLDMGVEAFLLGSSLQAVLAQRLVRTICAECRAPHRPDAASLARVAPGLDIPSDGTFYRGTGCRSCRRTGYRGRIGIFELLRLTEPVRRAILGRATAQAIADAAPADHEAMAHDGFRKAAGGLTTLEEVLRVTQDSQVADQ